MLNGRQRLAAGLSAATLLLSCLGGSAHRASAIPESQANLARPEQAPADRGTTRDVQPLPGVERVTVKLASAPDGRVKVLEFLSPDLSESERVDLQRAIEGGELRPETAPGRGAYTWVSTVLRRH